MSLDQYQRYIRDIMHRQGRDGAENLPCSIWVDSGLELRVLEGADKGRTIPLEAAFLMVGRGDTPTEQRPGWLLFGDRTVSRRQGLFCWNIAHDRFTLYNFPEATNPLRVNGQHGSEFTLTAGDQVKMGNLVFQLFPRPPRTWRNTGAYHRLPDGERWVNTRGLALTTIQGPGRGQTFVLNKNVHRVGYTDARTRSIAYSVWLEDPIVHTDQAALVWSDSTSAYTILQSRLATTPTWVFKGDEPEAITLSADTPLRLAPGDLMVMGSVQMAIHTELASFLEEDVTSMLRADGPPTILIRESAPTHITTATMAATDSVLAQTAEAITTSRWSPSSEWAIRIVTRTGPGIVIPIMNSTLTSSRNITLGSPGPRANDIDLGDPQLPNEAARLEFRDGYWVLVPEALYVPILVNGTPVRGKTEIRPHDRVEIGHVEWHLIHSRSVVSGPAGAPGLPPRPGSFTLEVVQAPNMPTGTRYPLVHNETVVGRELACDLVIADPSVSRRHVAVTLKDTRYWLQPLSSTNPTFVNGVQVFRDRLLQHGDQIQLSRDSTLVFIDLQEEVF